MQDRRSGDREKNVEPLDEQTSTTSVEQHEQQREADRDEHPSPGEGPLRPLTEEPAGGGVAQGEIRLPKDERRARAR